MILNHEFQSEVNWGLHFKILFEGGVEACLQYIHFLKREPGTMKDYISTLQNNKAKKA